MAAEGAISQFLVQEGTEKYVSACNLNDNESKNDPETDPYKSKYKAREILAELKQSLEKLKEEHSPNLKLTVMTAGLDLKLGVNYSDTEETASGQSHLEFCISALQEHKLNALACNILQKAYNHIGILWTGRRKPREALGHLQRAESLYKDYKQNTGDAPCSLDELFQPEGVEDDRKWGRLEDDYTHTLYYLAQVLSQLGEPKKSAEYCHVTLKRQLEMMKYDPLDWALNAATLSQFYISADNFKMARHCLASATVILKELGDPVTKCEISEEDSQVDVDRKEKLPQTWSDLYRCWAKYGLALLRESKAQIIRESGLDSDENEAPQEEEGDHNADKKTVPSVSQPQEDGESNGSGDSPIGADVYFNLDVTSSEDQITDQWLQTFDDARPVFLSIQKWLNLAKEFYILDGHCTDHVELIQDHSTAFKSLAFYEPDLDRQCKMNKRRIDMLTDILGQLSTQFYMLICRQLMFEIAETYSHMLDLKLALIETSAAPPSPHAAKKINALCEQGIAHFNTYLNTLKTAQKELPKKFADDDERPALIAHFYIGRLYSKLLQYDVTLHLTNLKQSLDMYKFLVDYCNTNVEAQQRVPDEYDVCKEMVVLLPHKMEKIRQRGTII